MTDRVYPSAKPPTATTTNPSFPATKSQLYGATRPTYRPQPHHRRRSRRRWCCTFCFWLILLFLILLLLIGLSGTVVYLLYRPHRPSFSVTSLKLSYLNLTSSSSTLSSKFDLTLSATNPNKKISFSYHPTSLSIFSNEINLGDGTVPGFRHPKKNTTVIKASIKSSGVALQSDAAARLKSSMKSKTGLPLNVNLETKVKAIMGNLKTPNVGIRVSCEGIKVTLPSGKKPATATTSNAKCDVDVRFKIWKWTIG